MAAPTLTSSTTSTYSDNVNTDEVTGTLSWNSGDRILVVAATEDQGFTLSTPTATGLTFSALGTAITVSNSCWLHAWTATAGSSGSGAITAARATGTGIAMRGISAFAFSSCTGFVRTNKGGGSGSVNGTEVVSVTRTQANSAMVVWSGDWSASGTTGLGWTPAGQTQVIAQTNTGATMLVARWGDQGATGTADYGSTGLPGTAFTVSGVEVLGSSSATASAELASGAATAYEPTVTITPEAPPAAGAAAALDPVVALVATAECATAAAVADDATVSTSASTVASAECATAAGAAPDPVVSVVALAECATAAGTAHDATAASGGTQTLFTTQTPVLGDNSDGTPGITCGVTLRFAVDGTVPAVRFYSTSTISGTYTAALYTVDSSDPGTGTALASKTMGSAPTAAAWNTVTFDSPVSVTAGTLYRAAIFSGAGRYVATTGVFGSDLVNGDITADADGDTIGAININQGTFRIDGAGIGYPNSDGNGTNYFVDVQFSTGSAPAVASAEAAGASGSAFDAVASVVALAECASVAATADDAAVHVAVAAETATAAGVADDATVSTSASTVASAECATAAGAAPDPVVSVVALAEYATAAGTAYEPTVVVPGGTQTLFTTQTPVLGDNSDGTPGITCGVTLRFAVDGTVPAVRFYSTSTISGTYTAALYTVDSSDPGTGTALASKTMGSAPTAAAWNTVTFDSPVSVTAGTLYRAAIFSGAGRYVATTGVFGSDLVNGDITADADGDTIGAININQGTFRIDGAGIGYPNSDGNGTNYFVDVEFVTGAPVTAEAECATAGATAYDPAVSTVPNVVASAECATAGADALWETGTLVSLTMISDAPVDAVSTAYDAGAAIVVPAQTATAVAEAHDSAGTITVAAEAATASGTAYNAPVTTNVVAAAECATGTATAADAVVALAPVSDAPAEVAGTAYDAGVAVTVMAQTATAGAEALDPVAQVSQPGTAAAETALAGASAFDAVPAVVALAEVATADSAALSASVVTVPDVVALAQCAEAAAAAFTAAIDDGTVLVVAYPHWVTRTSVTAVVRRSG